MNLRNAPASSSLTETLNFDPREPGTRAGAPTIGVVDMNGGCFARGLSQNWFELTAGEAVTMLPLLSFAFAVMAAPVVLRFYQRRVGRLMSAGAGEDTVAALTLRAAPPPPATATDRLAFAARQSARLRNALAAAVAAFALPTALMFVISPDEPGTPLDLTPFEWVANTVVYVMFIASLCIPIVLLGTSSRNFRKLFWLLFAPLYLFTVAAAVLYDEAIDTGERFEMFLVGVLILLLLYAGIGGRRMRNVVPMLTLFITLLWVALMIFGWAMGIADACLHPESALYILGAWSLLIGSVWLLSRAAFALLRALSAAYERKAFSGTQFQIGIWSLIILGIFMLGVGPEQDALSAWSAGVVAAFAGGLWIYRRQLARLEPPRAPLRLLMLRVFASDKRGERLLDEVAYYWRFIGPIYLVGGPDLAKSNLDPHELFALLKRRLGELFIRDAGSLSRHLEQTDEQPDPDTRYRVNEFFCSDNTWRATVESLVGGMHAIVLDLRGFTAQRRGTRFEVTLLARLGLLARTVILTDARTDLEAVTEALADTPGTSLEDCVVIDTRHKRDPDALLRGLLACALGPATT